MQVVIKVEIPDDDSPFVVQTAGDTPSAWQRRKETDIANVATFIGAFLQLRMQEQVARRREQTTTVK